MLVFTRKSRAIVAVMAAPLHWTEMAPSAEALVAVLRAVALVVGAVMVVIRVVLVVIG